MSITAVSFTTEKVLTQSDPTVTWSNAENCQIKPELLTTITGRRLCLHCRLTKHTLHH